MKRTATIAAAFAFGGAVALLSVFVFQRAEPVTAGARQPVWNEVKWPFPMDQWGEGAAFQCKAADCGVELTVYLRAKFGFCSSTIGVADDDELERLSNFDFMDGSYAALGAGREIKVGWMNGRIRAYGIGSGNRPRSSALTAAFNNDSDAMVATVLLKDTQPAAVEPAILEFLNGAQAQRWVKVKLGL